jgi:hypothetical protein
MAFFMKCLRLLSFSDVLIRLKFGSPVTKVS